MIELDLLLGANPEISELKVRYILRQLNQCEDSNQIDSVLQMFENFKQSHSEKVLKKSENLFNFIKDLIIAERYNVQIIEV